MAYRISKSDGSIIIVNDYEFNTNNTSLTLVGRGQINFGEPIAGNLVHMLENFSSPTAPSNPITGQLWFQTGPITVGSNNAVNVFRLKVFRDDKWVLANAPYSGPIPPANPELGDLWFNTTDQQLYYCSATGSNPVWDQTSQIFTGDNPPVAPLGGNLPNGTPWLMTPESMLWVWDNGLASGPMPPFNRESDGSPLTGKWRLVGPQAPQNHNTYIIGRTISGRKVLVTYVNNDIVSIENPSATFLAGQTELPGFKSMTADGAPDAAGQVTVHAGITINQTLVSSRFGGTAVNTTLFNLEKMSSFLGTGESANVKTTPITNLTIDLGSATLRWKANYTKDFYAGTSTTTTDDVSVVNVHGKASRAAVADTADKWTTARTGTFDGQWLSGNQTFDGNANYTITTTGFGTAGQAYIQSTATTAAQAAINTTDNFVRKSGNTATGYSGDVGSPGSKFSTIYATTFNGNATSANYADLGERYESDREYKPGTLVKIGGDKEITATTHMDPDFFGVISTAPGFILNDAAGPDTTHPVVGLVGRVPVRVIGPVKKGQRIVCSSAPGIGVAADLLKAEDIWCVVGRALEDKTEFAEALVLCAIGMK